MRLTKAGFHEHYLAELGAAVESQGISKPVRLLLIGGAYMMLLANAPRTTDDIDICWLEEGEDFHKARLALRDGVQAIARRYTLPPNWFNYLTQMLIYDKIIMPRGKLRNERSSRHLALCPAERNCSSWRMIYLASPSPLPRRFVVRQCTTWITRQDVHSRLKNAISQRNKRSLTCSEGEPKQLSIHTHKGVEVAAPLVLPRGGAEQHLSAIQ
jgi:hypothetical protein